MTVDEKPQVKELAFIITADEAALALRHLRDKTAMRDALVAGNAWPWVRDASGCRAFGPAYPCEFEDYCWKNVRVPEGNNEKPLSHSSAKEFLRCPERFRLLHVMGRPEDEENAPNVAGSVFHELMEQIYRGLQRIQGEKK